MNRTLARTPDPEVVQELLRLDDEEELETALAEAEPVTAARAVAFAPTLEQKTTLLWAMEDPQRRQVLEMLPAALVGALVQNLEDDNQYLLGDVSIDQFRNLLSLCSPERQFYWVTTALGFTDARANILPLLLTTRELVAIFLTRSEFENHLRAIGEYPIEDARIAPDLFVDPAQTIVDLIGPVNMLTEFPIKEPGLARVLQTILDYDQDRYVDLLREGLRAVDYQENHPLEWDALTEDPMLVDALEAPPAPGSVLAPEEEEEGEGEEGAPVALVPVERSPLVRLAAELPVPQRQRIADELQHLFIRQAVAEGGSFLLSDLQRVARSVEAYLLLGLQAETGGQHDREAAVLQTRPLHKISLTGAREVERLRQVALRLRPLEKVLDAEQRALIKSLVRPRLTLSAEGAPRLWLLPGGTLPELTDLDTATSLLHDVGAWTALARGVGLAGVEKALARAERVAVLLEELSLAAVLYGRLELELVEPSDRSRFRARYLREGGAVLAAEAREGVRKVAAEWAPRLGVDAELIGPLLERALEHLVVGEDGAVAG